MDNDKIMQIQAMEQEANQLRERLQIIDENIEELKGLEESLNELEKNKEKEIFVNLGKKIYLESKIKSDKLLVDVGNKNFVKKNFKEAKEIIKQQIEKLSSSKLNFFNRIKQIEEEIKPLLEQN